MKPKYEIGQIVLSKKGKFEIKAILSRGGIFLYSDKDAESFSNVHIFSGDVISGVHRDIVGFSEQLTYEEDLFETEEELKAYNKEFEEFSKAHPEPVFGGKEFMFQILRQLKDVECVDKKK